MARLKPPKTEQEIKSLTLSNVRKEYNEIARDYSRVLEGKVFFCHKCNDFHAASMFYTDKRYASGYFPECKESLLLEATDYDKKSNTYTDNREKTIEVFRKLDLPFIDSLYNSALNQINGEGEKVRATAYQQMLVMVKTLSQYAGNTFEHSEIEDTEIYENQSNKKARKEIKRIFGSGFTESDYLYLQEQYDDWRSRTEINSKSQETYLVQICFKQLEIWKAQKANRDTDKLVKSLNDLMNGANLQPRQNISNSATDSLTFGQLIEKWEMEKPIPEPSEEFKDCDGIGKYIRVWFSGWLSKALGLSNKFSQEFEDEIAKYEVKKPEIQDEASSDDIYNQLFGKDGE